MLSPAGHPQQFVNGSEQTLFSQVRFVDIVSQIMPGFGPIEIRLDERRTIAGVARSHSYGLRSISLCPFGLYAHPYGSGELTSIVRAVVESLKAVSTVSFEWNVRFDHELLAQTLLRHNLESTRTLTHVLWINGEYETTFASYNATARNLVRRTRREGLVVRISNAPREVSAYYDMHLRLASVKGNYGFIYPKGFFDLLLKLSEDVAFVVAEHHGRIIGGAWFFRDGDSLFYWHSATDPDFSKHSPMYAILDYAIQMAHHEHRRSVNLGGSLGMPSLEGFKEKWGAEPRLCWRFHWQNPLWKSVQRARTYLRAHA